MANGDDLISVEEASALLDVSVQHIRRLAHSGRLTKVARGLIDRASVDRYQAQHRRTRTRAWAEHTAWAAIAILAGSDAAWLGASQASRLRGTLRRLEDPNELLARLRDRARVEHYAAHRAVLPRIREIVAQPEVTRLGLVDLADDSVDGYIDASALSDAVRTFGLRRGEGSVTLRVTAFDYARVRELVTGNTVVAALDAAGSVDPRTRGVGERVITEILAAYR